jgi:hypothetical protein
MNLPDPNEDQSNAKASVLSNDETDINKKIQDAANAHAQKKYIESGLNLCPVCGSDAIEAEPLHAFPFDSGKVDQMVRCYACDAKWFDIYEFVRFEMVKDEPLIRPDPDPVVMIDNRLGIMGIRGKP